MSRERRRKKASVASEQAEAVTAADSGAPPQTFLREVERKQELLRTSLCAMVPLYVLVDLKYVTLEEIQAEAHQLADVIAECGDHILYRAKPFKGRGAEKQGAKPDTVGAFAALAKAVALLSFAPGGVKVFGLRFETLYDPAGCHRIMKAGVLE